MIYELNQKTIEVYLSMEMVDNEEVKVMARQVSQSHRRFDFNFIPVNYIKHLLQEKTIDIWNQRWESTTKGLQTKLFFPSITDRKKAKHFTLDFHTTQVMTNHGVFKSYLNRFNIVDNN
jgi:hypothetical protein